MYLYETKYWKIIFKEKQSFLGRCKIVNKEKKRSLSELTSEEWVELGKIEKDLEDVMKCLFDATMFNFVCLMNNAYRDETTPYIHFHFIPRYNHEVVLFEKKYSDKHFGNNFYKWSNDKKDKQKNIFSTDEIADIYLLIKKELDKKFDKI